MAKFLQQSLYLCILLSCGGAVSAFTNSLRPSLFPPKSSINGLQRQHCNNPSQQKALASGGKHRRQACMPTYLKSKLEENETNSDNNTMNNEALTQALESKNLSKILSHLQSHTSSIPSLSNAQLQSIFYAIELATAESDENTVNKRAIEDATINSASSGGGDVEFRALDRVRAQMTKLYRLLREKGQLNVFGAIGRAPPSSIAVVPSFPEQGPMYPTSGSKLISPTLLEEITTIEMINLTPQPTNLLLYGGAALASLEAIASLSLGINFNVLVVCTLLLALMDQVLVSGAVSETALRMVQPEMTSRITKHEAGHFLCAYLLGCPVEGVVLSTWAALNDGRFGGRVSAVSAGTSYYDIDLSEQIAGKKPLTRESIDRFSIIVMGGIAAEAVEFGRADGGAGDEEALVRFLRSLNPRSGNAVSAWTPELIRNQARWGATQAVLLLKEYKPCYDALVDALERGGGFGRADGGAGDEEALVRFLRSLNPRSGNAVSAWTPELIRNQARWGATQAVLLLKEYKPCYDALVDALERGGDLGQCIVAIEEAAAREGLGWLRKPMGKVLEGGEYGNWVPIDEENTTNGSSDFNTSTDMNGSNGDMSQTNGSSSISMEKTNGVPTYGEDPITSTEEFLKKYRDVM
eukprot:CAMPEP_0202030386 /NCGR_PEP_ID=MMETSP0905-20130828/64468_1 /ASSEMBLY_ACC=CAM_ASM_000554 /TAXON_ID=420261 /ORGANISM="Thalassiosira antarctica, Strain CCMP982" /LENGTH=636 /DNA_ID=CAMNT_0048594183 /DNA_START=112 /DNA_END=2020 /DNA_ORIENTATION=+